MYRWSQVAVSILLVSLVAPLYAEASRAWKDPSPHVIRFVNVDRNVRLEVLDWGGSGRAIILLAGGGDTAHVFDEFALHLTARYHVYGITRRGFGASAYSATDYSADRLGDDVLAIMEFLKLHRPVLVGHSIGGEELSSIASRYPDRVAGLVYLDAAYPYAFDNGEGPKMKEFEEIGGPEVPSPAGADLASFSALQKYFEWVNGVRFPESELRQRWDSTPDGRVGKSRDFPGGSMLLTGIKKYANIPAPALVIFANPHSQGSWINNSTDLAVRKAAKIYFSKLAELTDRQEKAVEKGVPAARVIAVPNASHYVFLSNEAYVLRQMRDFLAGLN